MQDVQTSSFHTTAACADGQPHTSELKILRHEFPDGTVPEWYVPPENIIALIKGFEGRYQAIQQAIGEGDFSYGVLEEIRKLSSNFFAAWEVSSRCILDTCGVENTIGMLELFVTNRDLFWDLEYLSAFDSLSDRIKIFRGGSGCDQEVLKGYSWSLFKDFAQMFIGKSGDPVLLQAEVEKENILLISFGSEMEIVPRPRSISNIVQLDVRLSISSR